MDLKIHFYYLYDLCTCRDSDQTQFLMNLFYIKNKHIFYTKNQSCKFLASLLGDFSKSLVAVLITW